MIPASFAAFASSIMPVSTICSAIDMPTIRGRNQVRPQSAPSPRLTKMAEKRDFVSAKRRSQASAKASPAPTATPPMAAMTGLSTSMIMRVNSAKGPPGVLR